MRLQAFSVQVYIPSLRREGDSQRQGGLLLLLLWHAHMLEVNTAPSTSCMVWLRWPWAPTVGLASRK